MLWSERAFAIYIIGTLGRSELVLILFLIILFGCHLEEASDCLIRVLHEHVLTLLLSVAIYTVHSLLQNRPTLLHVEVNLVAERASVDSIGA